MPISFRFRWIPFAAAMAVAGIGISLGQWQTRRALEKEGIEARMQTREMMPPVALGAADVPLSELEYRRVRVRGEFIREWPVYLDNRPYQGRAGFYLLMPLKIAGTEQAVLVARGWIPRNVADRSKLPVIATPAGGVEIEGMVREHAARLFQFGAVAPLKPGAIVQNAEIAEFAVASKLSLKPFLIEQGSAVEDGLVRDWPRASLGIDKHRGYAFQWYGLAVTAFIFFVVTGCKRGTR